MVVGEEFMGKYVAYIRVSTKDQNLDRQIADINYELGRDHHKLDRIFEEKVSGKSREKRPQLKAMMEYVQEGDTLIVESYSRLARSTKDLLNIVDELNEKKVQFISVKERIDTSTPQGKLMLTIFAGLSEFERTNMLERVGEGIKVKKEKGEWIMRGKVYGYNHVTYKDDGKTPLVTINETEAKYIRLLYQGYLAGKSSLALVKEYGKVMRDETNYRLGPDSINRILFRVCYMGYVTRNSLSTYDDSKKRSRDYTRISRMTEEQLRAELVRNSYYPPIVSEELWWGCFNSYRTVTRKNSTQYAHRFTAYELTGIIRTSCNCHASFVHSNSKQKNWQGEVYKPTKHNDGCTDRMFTTLQANLIKPIMRLTFWLTFKNFTGIKKFYEEQNKKREESLRELNADKQLMETNIAEAEKKIKNLYSFIVNHGEDEYSAENMKTLKEELESKREHLQDIEKAINSSPYSFWGKVKPFSEEELNKFINCDTAEIRRDMYSKYCTAEMSRDTLTVKYLNGQKFIVHWHFTRTGHEKPFQFEQYFDDKLEATGCIEPISNKVSLDCLDIGKDDDVRLIYSAQKAKDLENFLKSIKTLDEPELIESPN